MGNMVNLSADEPKKWYLSTGFIFSAVIVLIAGFNAYDTQTGEAIAKAVVEAIASVGLLLRLVKSGFDFKKWLTNSNTWGHLGVIVVLVFGQSFEAIVPALRSIAEAIAAKNFQMLFSSLFALATIIWNLVRNGAGLKKPVI